ncbi:MAG: phosphatidate cytidylyltransferase [Epsilonproteobacteria bacterium]|nr:phosphatidate cytidylyltransferase [Campylobacterota bacterium]
MKINEILSSSKERIITALVLIVGLGVVLLLNNMYLIWLIFGIVYVISLYEAGELLDVETKMAISFGIVTWIGVLILKHAELLAFVPLLSLVSYRVYKNQSIKDSLLFIYPSMGIFFMFALYKDYGVFALLWLIVVVSMTDTFAYFSGKYLGKRKFSEVSPNKTLEGVMGGVVAGSLFGSLVGLYAHGFVFSLMLSFLVSVFSVFGDLFESYLKRMANVKDSGNIFPGHGGMLDRLDGYLFGVIILYIGMVVF